MYQRILFTLILFLKFSFLGFSQDHSLEVQTVPHVAALYKNCGNEITITNPVMSPKDNVRYECKGGMVMNKYDDVRVVTIVPDSPRVTLSIFRDTLLIGQIEFKVRLINKPTINLYADSNLVENLNPHNVKLSRKTRYITLKAKPDEVFAAFLPQDAKYSVTSWKLILIRGAQTIDSLMNSQETIDVKPIFSKAKKGDRIYIEVYEVIRKNFMNKVENVNVGTIIKMIPLE
jgi:hypothetical protein